MSETTQTNTQQGNRLPLWAAITLPLLALLVTALLFAVADPIAVFRRDQPPIEELSIQRIKVREDGFHVIVYNDAPNPVTISQVLVDDAYWTFEAQPTNTIPQLGKARIHIPYPWVEFEAHEVTLVTPAGATISEVVSLATPLPGFGWRQFNAYGIIGIFVGVIPVALGVLWFPALKKLDRKWLEAVLALTVGLLVFLLLDTFLEAVELARDIPNFFQGIPLALFAALLTWFVLLAIGSRQDKEKSSSAGHAGLNLAGLIALGIGFHNLGEGLAIGAAFATGEAALGSFLVIGFMLHNITEGIGIAAPLLPAGSGEEGSTPGILTFVWLVMLAGVPASIGAWIGGFAFSPILATVFFGIGIGAIWQVIVDVSQLMIDRARRRDTTLFSWTNLLGFSLGILVMYLTGFLT